MRCAFSPARLMQGVTPVDNLFIAEYMPAAPENYVKVYLYGLMLCASYAEESDDLQTSLGLDAQEVLAAFSYWQALGLVRIVDADKLYIEYTPQRQAAVQRFDGERRYGMLIDRVQEALGGRILLGSDLQKLYDWVEVFSLEADCILELVSYIAAERGNRISFFTLDKIAKTWADAGVKTGEDARKYVAEQQELRSGAQRILRRWRMSRRPTEDELHLYEKWTHAWGFDDEAISAACVAATGTDKPNFSYLDAILENLRMQGAVTEEAVDRIRKEEDARRELCRMMFARAGIKRTPRSNEREEIGRWNDVYGMSAELLLFAAELASSASSPYGFMKKLIQRWHEQDIRSVSAARSDYEAHGTGETKAQVKSASQALGFAQRKYSEDDLKRLGIDLGDE